MSGGTMILVVEDEPLLREVVVQELEDAGYRVAAAEDGAGALDHLARRPEIAGLFTDIRLPGALTGWDIAERAREMRPDLPVIYSTGFTPDEQRVVRGGLFFRKPYRPRAIIAALEQLGIRPEAG